MHTARIAGWGRGTAAARAPAGPPAAVPALDTATRGAREPMSARCSLPRAPPGRPPSRLDRRPRAGGTRGSARAPCGRAVRALMFELNRTRVRKIRRPSDRPGRTYVRPDGPGRNVAQPSQIVPSDLQRKLQVCSISGRLIGLTRSAAGGPAGPETRTRTPGAPPWADGLRRMCTPETLCTNAAHQPTRRSDAPPVQVPGLRAANSLSTWLLPLPEDAAAVLSWAGRRVRSPWRSSSSTAASRSPAR